MAPLPSVRYLKNLDEASRKLVLTSHAGELYREAAHAVAPRFSYGAQFAHDGDAQRVARARRSSRDRLRRLYDRADHFGINVGQPRVLASNATIYYRYAANDFSTKTTFDFDEAFQSKIGALLLRDTSFAQRSEGLLKPEYFTNKAEASLARIALDYYGIYKKAPDKSIVGKLLKDAVDSKKIRKDLRDDIEVAFGNFLRADISDRNFVLERVEDFVRRRFVFARHN